MGDYRSTVRERIAAAQPAPVDVAVIGIGCRFPGAPDLDAFWRLLCRGGDAIGEVPRERWDWRDTVGPDPSRPLCSRWGGFVTDVEQFDPEFFGFTQRQAELCDPQQRLFLETAWRALEHAGHAGQRLAGSATGVFAGVSNQHYLERIRPQLTPADHGAGLANDNAVLPNRLSFLLDLNGPSLAVDTLCSSALVALHLACASLASGECEQAIVGGVNVLLSPAHFLVLGLMNQHSPDGRCRAFDARANGFVSGEGVAVVVLKPLARARRDGDVVHAVLRGSAVGHHGRTNSLASPSPRAQARVIARALAAARIAPDAIGYVEAHGTGTPIGDGIEIAGLTRVFGSGGGRRPCPIGSVKTNVGHLEAAGGMAGLLKAVLALRHGEIPASLHFTSPNPMIPFADTPFRVVTAHEAWDDAAPRIAGVSAMGLSGTNAHVVVAAGDPVPSDAGGEHGPLLLVLSARSRDELARVAAAHRDHLERHPEMALGDLCATAAASDPQLEHRLMIRAEARADLLAGLRSAAAGDLTGGEDGALLTVGRVDPSVAGAPALADDAAVAWPDVAERAGRAWLGGATVDWQALWARRAPRSTALPPFPLARRRCWIDAAPAGLGDGAAGDVVQALAAASGVPGAVAAECDSIDLADGDAPAAPARAAAGSDVVARLTAIVADATGIAAARIPSHAPLSRLGIESLQATAIAAAVRDAFAVELRIVRLFEGATIDELAREIAGAPRTALADGRASRLIADPEKRHEPFPLTDLQQAYWIGRMPGVAYGGIATQIYFELEHAAIDLDRLSAAWRRLVARHDMLRAVVLPDGRQRVLAEVTVAPIVAADLRDVPPEARSAALAAMRDEMAHAVRDAERWPLCEWRASLLPDDVTRLHFAIDMLVADARSIHLIASQLIAAYLDPDAALAPLDVTFRDYVLACEARRDGPAYRRAEQYWNERLDELPPGPELPVTSAVPERPRFVRRAGRVEAERWQRVKQCARELGVTPSAVLCTAYARVLGAWSASTSFTINVTTFNRAPLHPAVGEIIGDFTAVELLAVELRGEPFAAEVQRLQERLWSDLDHSLVSGVQVLRALAKRRGGFGRALMPVVFTSLLGHGDVDLAPAAGDEGFAPVFGLSQTPQVWLDHQVAETGGALAFTWDAVEDLFPAGVLDAMFAGYLALLDELADGVDAWRRAPRALLPSAQAAVRRRVNATEAALDETLLNAPFAAHARRAPERIAVVAADRTLTYGALDALANRLARRLVALDAQPNELVAVVADKGWQQIAAVLGILASGAAYVPIDPELPALRVAQLLASSGARIAVASADAAARVAWPAEVQVVRVDRDDELDPSAEPLAARQRADDLAYVIYTSGSTGVPKGVMIDHRGAMNTIADVNRRFAVGGDDAVLALSSLSFDLSVYDVFGLLAVGGKVVVPPADAARDPARWLRCIAEAGVTIWNSVPALLQMAVESVAGAPAAAPASLRLALLSGDWIPVALPDRVRALWPAIELVSLGGATEASIWSIAYPIATVDPCWSSIPYGRALANQQIHVLDAALHPCPDWVTGEIYIGGTGVALGYWRDPVRTRASFVRCPHSGERLYRTGDLGRVLPGGDVEFLGRRDAQVKVGGHRIELGEIEAALLAHPRVGAAVAAAVAGASGEKRLAAWFVVDGGEANEAGAALAAELRAFLHERLPAYMVPASLTPLAALPLSANGKLDRAALTLPAPVAVPYVAPRSRFEQELAALWQEELGRDRVGLDDSFFDLGAESITLVRVQRRIALELGIAVPVVELFRHATIRALATRLRDGDAGVALDAQRARGSRQRAALERRARREDASVA